MSTQDNEMDEQVCSNAVCESMKSVTVPGADNKAGNKESFESSSGFSDSNLRYSTYTVPEYDVGVDENGEDLYLVYERCRI